MRLAQSVIRLLIIANCLHYRENGDSALYIN